MRKLLIGMASLATLSTVVFAPSRPTEAQILMVTGNYRITEMDQTHERFGVALTEAKPDVRQNWVYVSPSTETHMRYTNTQGWHKDENLSYYQFFEQVKPGTMVRITGGRRWDGEITGKKMWIGFPEKMKE
jgi:hypothetical protein